MVVSIVVVGTSLAGDPVQSGLKPGVDLDQPRFDAVELIEHHRPEARARLSSAIAPVEDLRLCRSRVVVAYSPSKTSEPLAANLVKQIDKKIGENRTVSRTRLRRHHAPKMATQATSRYRRCQKAGHGGQRVKNIPLTMIGEKDGPPDYEISSDADITVLMWKQHKVKVNHAYKGELTDKEIETIVSSIPKVLE